MRRSQPPPDDTTPRQNLRSRFPMVFESRIQSVIDRLDYLQDMAVPSRWHYQPEEWQQGIAAIQEKLEEVTNAFESGRGRFSKRFRLK